MYAETAFILNLKNMALFTEYTYRMYITEYTQNLVDSMPKRCKAIIDNEGDWILDNCALKSRLTLIKKQKINRNFNLF